MREGVGPGGPRVHPCRGSPRGRDAGRADGGGSQAVLRPQGGDGGGPEGGGPRARNAARGGSDVLLGGVPAGLGRAVQLQRGQRLAGCVRRPGSRQGAGLPERAVGPLGGGGHGLAARGDCGPAPAGRHGPGVPLAGPAGPGERARGAGRAPESRARASGAEGGLGSLWGSAPAGASGVRGGGGRGAARLLRPGSRGARRGCVPCRGPVGRVAARGAPAAGRAAAERHGGGAAGPGGGGGRAADGGGAGLHDRCGAARQCAGDDGSGAPRHHHVRLPHRAGPVRVPGGPNPGRAGACPHRWSRQTRSAGVGCGELGATWRRAGPSGLSRSHGSGQRGGVGGGGVQQPEPWGPGRLPISDGQGRRRSVQQGRPGHLGLAAELQRGVLWGHGQGSA